MVTRNDEQQQKRVAFYIRVSTDDQADKYGPDLQRSALEKLIGSKGQLDNGEVSKTPIKLQGERSQGK